jgi:hypothetical protein
MRNIILAATLLASAFTGAYPARGQTMIAGFHVAVANSN